MPDLEIHVNDFAAKLRHGKVEGSQAVARQTAELLRAAVSQQRLSQTDQAAVLSDRVKSIGDRLIAANPIELAALNIVRRVLHIIREENHLILTRNVEGSDLSFESDERDAQGADSSIPSSAAAVAARSFLHPTMLHALLNCIVDSEAVNRTSSTDGADRSRKLKHAVIKAINELIQEVDTCHEQIAEQAVEHIHQDEVILTLGHSRTVLEFLYAAKEKKRSFRVFVAEGAPRFKGQALAKELVSRGLQTTLITDSAVFAIVSRVNMVIIGAHAVMTNGGVVAPVGMNMVALAARKHGVPVVVLAGTHKFCPLHPHNPEVLLNDLKSPSDLLDFGEFSDCMNFASGTAASLHVVNPSFDYIPPDLISLFITDVGGHQPSYMYRLMADFYSADDLVTQQNSAFSESILSA